MDLELFIKILFLIILNAFGLVIYWSFHFFKMGSKDNDYAKVMKELGFQKDNDRKKEVVAGKKVERKPSTVMKRSNYWLPVIFFTMVCLIVSSLFLFPNAFFPELFQEGTAKFSHNPFFLGMYFGKSEVDWANLANPDIADLQRRSIATLAWGFMGAFLWASSNMVRRLAKADITPILYYKAAFRILFACAIALIFSFISNEVQILDDMAFTNSFVPALAFVAGTLPERFFNYLLDMLKSIIGKREANTKELHLRNIEGLSAMHRERLWEEGIDNAQNLSQAGLMQLMLKTPFEARQILDWMGQAKLICYMKEDIDKAYDVGIRSAFDFIALKETYTERKVDNMNALQELGQTSGFTTPILAVVSELVNNDVGTKNLKVFLDRLNGKKDNKIVTIYEDSKEETKEKDASKFDIPADIPK